MKDAILRALEELTGCLNMIDVMFEPDPQSDYEDGANQSLIMMRHYINNRITALEREVIK